LVDRHSQVAIAHLTNSITGTESLIARAMEFELGILISEGGEGEGSEETHHHGDSEGDRLISNSGWVGCEENCFRIFVRRMSEITDSIKPPARIEHCGGRGGRRFMSQVQDKTRMKAYSL
jgi:hypothetical protein